VGSSLGFSMGIQTTKFGLVFAHMQIQIFLYHLTRVKTTGIPTSLV
jgi:hypothetical protein